MVMEESRKQAMFSRKFLSSLVVAAILVGVLLVIALTGNFSEGIFTTWLLGLLANFGIYTTGNVGQKWVSGRGEPPTGVSS